MLEAGWFLFTAIVVLLLVGGALIFALRSQRRMTPAQRRDLHEALDGETSDEEADEGCPVRVVPFVPKQRSLYERGVYVPRWDDRTRSTG